MRTVDEKIVVALHQIRDAIKNKDCCNGGESDSSSKEITIDDVVKFIHDDLADTTLASMFPYTTWDEIPNYNSVDVDQVCKTTSLGDKMSPYILYSFHYIIGMKGEGDLEIVDAPGTGK